MSNEQLKFWITCPDCKKPFGVEPRYILQYLNRVIDAKGGGEPREEETENGGENRREASSACEGEHVNTAAPKAPYRKYRPGGYGKQASRREWAR